MQRWLPGRKTECKVIQWKISPNKQWERTHRARTDDLKLRLKHQKTVSQTLNQVIMAWFWWTISFIEALDPLGFQKLLWNSRPVYSHGLQKQNPTQNKRYVFIKT